MNSPLRLRRLGLLLAISFAAIGVHGYHPYVEDAEIYLPGIKKILNPSLYPQNTGFFASHAGMTFFPNFIATFVRVSHLPFDAALLLWHVITVFVLLLACFRVGRIVFHGNLRAAWGGVALVASLLTIPIAGTALYLMDQYLNTRTLSAAMVMTMIACVEERHHVQAAIWAILTTAIHPLMAVFGISFAITLALVRTLPRLRPQGFALVAAFFPLSLFPPVSGAYHEALLSRSYFFLARWEWYELVGLIAPFAIFWYIARFARNRHLPELEAACKALNIFGLAFFAASLLTLPARLERFTLLQPMRYLHLTYILLFVFAGGLLAEYVLGQHPLRWLLLFLPLCAGMYYAQRQVFPGTAHLELPGIPSSNPWVQAFDWIRIHTPQDAYFAINPDHMKLDGEDQHGFRAIAERSMLADNVKDSGAVTMFPKIADTWKQQSIAQSNWQHFQREDFLRLQQTYGVTWVVLDDSAITGFNCPYANARLRVCHLN